MAINWGGGAQGAVSGASLGAMTGNPFAAAAGGILGGALGLFGGSGGGMQQVNPYAAPYWDLMNSNLNNYQRQMLGAERQQGSYLGGAQGYFNQLGSFSPTAQYDPQAAIRAFNAQAPQLQALAKQSMSPFGDVAGTAADRARSAGNKIAQQYQTGGALNSGAAASAIGEGATRAAGEINLAADDQFQRQLQQLYQMRGASLEQAAQNELQRQMTADQMRFQGIGAAGTGYMGIADAYGQRAAGYGNLVGNTQAGLGQMAGQEFVYTPPSNTGLDYLTAAAGIAGEAKSAGLFNFGGGGDQTQDQPNAVVPNIFNQPAPVSANAPAYQQTYGGAGMFPGLDAIYNQSPYQAREPWRQPLSQPPMGWMGGGGGMPISSQFTLPQFWQ